MACSTCDGYEFVDDPDGGAEKLPCPDCRGARTYRCPAHGDMVLVSRSGRLLGKCWGCINEAARAMREIETSVAA